jgi:hypothetical protein
MKHGGLEDPRARGTTTTVAADNEVAVWCWTGKPNDYIGYAIGSRGEVLFTQQLGPTYDSTPSPGPAPIN